MTRNDHYALYIGVSFGSWGWMASAMGINEVLAESDSLGDQVETWN